MTHLLNQTVFTSYTRKDFDRFDCISHNIKKMNNKRHWPLPLDNGRGKKFLILFKIEALCQLNRSLLFFFGMRLALKTPEALGFPRGIPLCQSGRSRQWPGKLAASNPALCSWKKKRVNIRRQFRKRQCNLPYEKLHVLHDNPRPQVKVLLHNLQQLVFVPVRCTVIKHRDGEWMAHTDGIGDLQGTTEMGWRINVLL